MATVRPGANILKCPSPEYLRHRPRPNLLSSQMAIFVSIHLAKTALVSRNTVHLHFFLYAVLRPLAPLGWCARGHLPPQSPGYATEKGIVTAGVPECAETLKPFFSQYRLLRTYSLLAWNPPITPIDGEIGRGSPRLGTLTKVGWLSTSFAVLHLGNGATASYIAINHYKKSYMGFQFV